MNPNNHYLAEFVHFEVSSTAGRDLYQLTGLDALQINERRKIWSIQPFYI